MGVDWESVIMHDAMYNVLLFSVFVFLQVVCVQSVVGKLYNSVFILGWVVRFVWDNSICKCGVSICGCLTFCRDAMYLFILNSRTPFSLP